jgi:hypothetical protein
MQTFEEIVQRWHAEQPHPKAPSVKVGEYPIAARLATILKFGQPSPGPQEVENFWHEFQSMNQSLQAQNKMPIGPEEFTHLAQQMARSSFAYHGRPPSMYEIQRMRDAHPKDVADFYAALPDEHYPTVSAGDMAKALQAAQPHAQLHLEREPNKGEAAYLVHSGRSPDDYYRELKQQSGTEDQAVGHAGIAGPGDAGGQPTGPRADDSRVASGSAAAGG